VVKIEEGGWVPIAMAVSIFTLLTTWKRGRDALGDALRGASLPLDLFLPDLAKRKPLRIPGTAVFMTSNVGVVPAVLLHHLKHNKVLHERVVLVSILTEEVPNVPEAERVVSDSLGEGFYRVVAHYGFMETPDVPKLLASLPERPPPNVAIPMNPMDTTFYLGRETLLPSGPAALWRWRKRLFIIMARNAATAGGFFGLPPNRVVEMGAQIQL
jgi:KUP system potassium uptake protein